jgi:high-affinity iron transporter
MPATCAPEVSPAVVRLEPVDSKVSLPPATGTSTVTLVNQKGLQFQPRIVALPAGQTVRFGNDDGEQHNIHILSAGTAFNQSMGPGQHIEFIPRHAGVLKLVCDIHSHMRAYIVVGASPWVTTCDRTGRFQFKDIPAGRYRLIAWHEMGDPATRTVSVTDTTADLGTIAVQSRAPLLAVTTAAKVEPWSEVIDRIGMTLAMSLDAAKRPGGHDRAVTLAQDAYFAEFEASAMETAVRSTLGLQRTHEIESQFRALMHLAADVSDGRVPPGRFADASRTLIVRLARTSQDLNNKGVSDRSKLVVSAASPQAVPPTSGRNRELQLARLNAAFAEVRSLADKGQAASASAALGHAYFDAFEPIESDLRPSQPAAVLALESRFNVLRGEIGAGLKGTALESRLAELRSEIGGSVSRLDARTASAFGLNFVASLGTILREGVEVILLLTMLFALGAKTGNPRAISALWWGVGLAAVASVITALGLNLLVGSARGQTRELLEGVVLLIASGVLFYVSYWLISRSESRRWLDFLKHRATEGAKLGGYLTLGLTAFLAVYREGAETALMYQAMIAQQTRTGRLGIAAGLALGLVLLAVIYYVIRATSVRLPMRRFFQVTGVLLFAMAVVFAGHGVFELQSSGVIKATAVRWLGSGVPALGLYPNVQCVEVQAILILGAVLACLLLMLDRGALVPSRTVASQTAVRSSLSSTAAGVRV